MLGLWGSPSQESGSKAQGVWGWGLGNRRKVQRWEPPKSWSRGLFWWTKSGKICVPPVTASLCREEISRRAESSPVPLSFSSMFCLETPDMFDRGPRNVTIFLDLLQRAKASQSSNLSEIGKEDNPWVTFIKFQFKKVRRINTKLSQKNRIVLSSSLGNTLKHYLSCVGGGES